MSHVFSNLCYHMALFVKWGEGGGVSGEGKCRDTIYIMYVSLYSIIKVLKHSTCTLAQY